MARRIPRKLKTKTKRPPTKKPRAADPNPPKAPRKRKQEPARSPDPDQPPPIAESLAEVAGGSLGHGLERAIRERWRIPAEARGELAALAADVMRDSTQKMRHRIACMRALLAADKLNLEAQRLELDGIMATIEAATAATTKQDVPRADPLDVLAAMVADPTVQELARSIAKG